MAHLSHLYGRLALDEAAADVLRSRQSWSRLTCGAADIRVETSDESVMLSLSGAAHADLGAYLAGDLAAAAAHGLVVGQLTEDCQDGFHARVVTCFDGVDIASGEGPCLRSPVRARRCLPRTVAELSEDSGALPDRALTAMVFLVPVPDSPVEALVGSRTVLWCACAGTDNRGRPICGTAGRPAPPGPA